MSGEFARQIMPMARTYSLGIASATLASQGRRGRGGGEGRPERILSVPSSGDPATNKTRSEGGACMSRAPWYGRHAASPAEYGIVHRTGKLGTGAGEKVPRESTMPCGDNPWEFRAGCLHHAPQLSQRT